MNADFDKELLSALLDGELSPAQADAVRQQVAESERLAAELAAIEKLSGAVRELPQVAAPASLQSGVMSRLEAGAGSTSPSRPEHRSIGGWTGVAGGLVAAIALCIVVVISTNGPDNQNQVADKSQVSRLDVVAESADAGIAAEAAADSVMGDVAPPSASLPYDRNLEMVIDTGLIQREAELVRVKLDPDQLRRQLVSARLAPKESNEAPEGYHAFVVEGSRSEINRVLQEFQRATGDLSIEIDRTSVPKPILDEFQMETALIALRDRGPVEDSERGGSMMKMGSAAPLAPSAGSGFSGGGSRTRTSTSPAREASPVSKTPGKRAPSQESRIATAKPGSSSDKNKDATVIAKKEAPRRIDATKVLFFYRLPTESPASKEPCAGA